MPNRTTRVLAAALVSIGAATLAAGPAGAHVSPDKTEVPAGGFTSVAFTVGHGCDGSPTTAVAIAIPESIPNVTPAVLPGWDVAIETEALAEPVEGPHGERFTERESVVTYTAEAGNELLDGFRTSFTIGFQAPDAEGETLLFPTIQTCAEGETAWIDPDPEAETPAPQVAVVAAEGDGHGASATGAEHDDETTDDVEVASAQPASSSSDDGSSSDGLAIGGLVLGALGLATGGAALARTRKATA